MREGGGRRGVARYPDTHDTQGSSSFYVRKLPVTSLVVGVGVVARYPDTHDTQECSSSHICTVQHSYLSQLGGGGYCHN